MRSSSSLVGKSSDKANRFRLAACVPGIALAFALGACSSGADHSNANVVGSSKPAGQATSAGTASGGGAGNAAPAQTAPTTPPASSSSGSTSGLSLQGLGDLRLGQAVPKGSSWAERGAQTSDECRTVSSPKYPGAYGIVTDGKVQRITLGKRSTVKLDGIGSGSAEQEVKKRFPNFVAEPHKYEDAPAKYLTDPGASSGKPAFRFEIGHDGKVSLIHAGMMPVLGYVEGCS